MKIDFWYLEGTVYDVNLDSSVTIRQLGASARILVGCMCAYQHICPRKKCITKAIESHNHTVETLRWIVGQLWV